MTHTPEFAVKKTDIEISAIDGFNLVASTFEPEADRAVPLSLQLNSAMGVHRGFYERFARFMSWQGAYVVTFDYRGVGDSARVPVRQNRATLGDWGKDIDAVAAWLKETRPENKLVCVSHSIGSPLLGIAHKVELFSALVIIASGTGYWRNWPGWNRYRLWLGWNIILPSIINLLGYLPAAFLGWDLPKQVAMDWVNWCKDKDGMPLTESMSGFRMPSLFLSFLDDDYSPPLAVDNLISKLPNSQVTHRQLRPSDLGLDAVGHFGFFKKTAPESAWLSVFDWIKANLLVQ